MFDLVYLQLVLGPFSVLFHFRSKEKYWCVGFVYIQLVGVCLCVCEGVFVCVCVCNIQVCECVCSIQVCCGVWVCV